jgi:hypothetical protein
MLTPTLTTRIACTLINEIVVDIDAAYRASRLGCQLSGCEIECPTSAHPQPSSGSPSWPR